MVVLHLGSAVSGVGWDLHGAEEGFASSLSSRRASSPLGPRDTASRQNTGERLPFPSAALFPISRLKQIPSCCGCWTFPHPSGQWCWGNKDQNLHSHNGLLVQDDPPQSRDAAPARRGGTRTGAATAAVNAAPGSWWLLEPRSLLVSDSSVLA